MHTTRIGDYSVGRITELQFAPFAATEFFPAATPEMVQAASRALPGRFTDDGKIVMSFHAFVLRTGRHTIMVDTCCGADKPRPGREQFNVGKQDFIAGLAAVGVKPEEVTHVMCTHLHWDHVGWNTRLVDGRWVPTFPNAKYVMAKREYDYWDGVYAKEKGKQDNMHALGFEDSVLPVMRAEKAILVADDYELDKGISLEPCHGHSPGHVVINVASGGKKGVFIGDVIHHPIQLLHPELSTRADFDQNAARASRTALIEKHAGTGTLVLPQHFATPTCGTIERAGGAFRFDFIQGSLTLRGEMHRAGPTRRLAEFVAGLEFSDLPDAVVAQACDVVLDTVGCALGAWRDDAEKAEIARSLALSFASAPAAAVWGGGGAQADASLAALANGILANAADFDDTHKRALLHTGSVIVPPALALAEALKLDGRDRRRRGGGGLRGGRARRHGRDADALPLLALDRHQRHVRRRGGRRPRDRVSTRTGRRWRWALPARRRPASTPSSPRATSPRACIPARPPSTACSRRGWRRWARPARRPCWSTRRATCRPSRSSRKRRR